MDRQLQETQIQLNSSDETDFLAPLGNFRNMAAHRVCPGPRSAVGKPLTDSSTGISSSAEGGDLSTSSSL